MGSRKFREYKQTELPPKVRDALVEAGEIEDPRSVPLVWNMNWRREGALVASGSPGSSGAWQR
jgi:hypothetical protein